MMMVMMMMNYTNRLFDLPLYCSYDGDDDDELHQQSDSLTCLCTVAMMMVMMMNYTNSQTLWSASVL